LWLESLVACAGVTFSVVATAMGIGFRSAQAVVKGKAAARAAAGNIRSAGISSAIRVFEWQI